MRARLAIASAGVAVELCEVVLRDKPEAFLLASPSATVPCLLRLDGTSIDESYDVMLWALNQNDPERWLQMPQAGHDLILEADGPFKSALDHTKYASRYPDMDAEAGRAVAMGFVGKLDAMLDRNGWLFGDGPSLADFAILPFIRQFAMIDKPRFDTEAGADVTRWLDAFLSSDRLAGIMQKYPAWTEGDPPTVFPSA